MKDWKASRNTWDEYEACYLKEMSKQRETIKEFAKRAKHSTITLLCFEPEENPCCHRHLLKRLIGNEI